jgi:hypothetical protein
MKTILRICLILALSLPGTQAQAIQITSSGQSFTVDWTLDIGSNTLSASSSWSVSSFSATQMVLDISIANTTLLSGTLTNADITTFGFGIDPNASASLLTSGTVFGGISAGSGPQQTFPGGDKAIDVCIFSAGCAGGSVTGGLHAGASDSLQLLLAGDFSSGTANLLYFPLKFQTSLGSYTPAGCVDCPTTGIPEPPVAALLGAGLLLLGLTRYSRWHPASARG